VRLLRPSFLVDICFIPGCLLPWIGKCGAATLSDASSLPCLALPFFSSIDQIILDRVINDICIVGHIHFLQYPGTVSTDRFYAQAQFIGDLRHALSLPQLVKYFVLPAATGFHAMAFRSRPDRW